MCLLILLQLSRSLIKVDIINSLNGLAVKAMLDYFDKIYSSIDYGNSFLRKLKYYAIKRRIVLFIGNIILPLYFRMTEKNPIYKI